MTVTNIRENDKEIDGELTQIKQTANEEKIAAKTTSWATVFSVKFAIAGIGVAAFQQFQEAIFGVICMLGALFISRGCS